MVFLQNIRSKIVCTMKMAKVSFIICLGMNKMFSCLDETHFFENSIKWICVMQIQASWYLSVSLECERSQKKLKPRIIHNRNTINFKVPVRCVCGLCLYSDVLFFFRPCVDVSKTDRALPSSLTEYFLFSLLPMISRLFLIPSFHSSLVIIWCDNY